MEQQPLIELSSISLHETESKNLHDASSFVSLIDERNVETSRGNIHVSVQGTRGKPAFVTFHDIGQNHTSAFLGFFNFHQVRPLLQHFCVYHIDAPGQEEGSPQLAVDYNYPTMDELAELLGEVVDHFALKSFIGFGIGAGANVLSRYALKHPIKVEGLVLVNCVSTTAGWVEWGYQKVCKKQLQSKGMTSFVEEYLLWHHFGKKTMESNLDLKHAYLQSVKTLLNPFNLSLYIESYISRTDLGIHRPDTNPNHQTIKVPILLLSGVSSPHDNDVVDMNARLDPKNSNYMKVSDSGGMELEEQPARVATALVLFLQGLGHACRLKAPPPPKPNIAAGTVTEPAVPRKESDSHSEQKETEEVADTSSAAIAANDPAIC